MSSQTSELDFLDRLQELLCHELDRLEGALHPQDGCGSAKTAKPNDRPDSKTAIDLIALMARTFEKIHTMRRSFAGDQEAISQEPDEAEKRALWQRTESWFEAEISRRLDLFRPRQIEQATYIPTVKQSDRRPNPATGSGEDAHHGGEITDPDQRPQRGKD